MQESGGPLCAAVADRFDVKSPDRRAPTKHRETGLHAAMQTLLQHLVSALFMWWWCGSGDGSGGGDDVHGGGGDDGGGGGVIFMGMVVVVV